MFFLKNFFKTKPPTEITKSQKEDSQKSSSEIEDGISKQNMQIPEEKHFRPEYVPEYINQRFIYDNQKYLNQNNFAADFSEAVINSLFGFDKSILKKCLLFSESQTASIGSAFSYLWEDVFYIHNKNALVDNKVAYDSIFNYRTGKLLIKKAEQLVVKNKVYGNTAEVTFKSCISTQGYANFEGYANFDFITILSIFLFKEKYPNIQTVKANVYFGEGFYLKKLLPVRVESTLDQRDIYGLINSR